MTITLKDLSTRTSTTSMAATDWIYKTDNGFTTENRIQRQDMFGQDLTTSNSPTFVDMTFTGITANRLLKIDGSSKVASVSDLTNWISGTANEIAVSDDGDGTVTLGLASSVILDYLTLIAQDGINEGGEMLFKGAGSYTDWVSDVYQNVKRFFTTNNSSTAIFDIQNSGTQDVSLRLFSNIGSQSAVFNCDTSGNLSVTPSNNATTFTGALSTTTTITSGTSITAGTTIDASGDITANGPSSNLVAGNKIQIGAAGGANTTIEGLVTDLNVSTGGGYILLTAGSGKRTWFKDGTVAIANDQGCPHGGIGYAKFCIDGANGSSLGPHIQYTTSLDDYPLFQQLNWTHDDIRLYFDSYFDGSDKSSDAGSNYRIIKSSDSFKIDVDSGITAGSAITWDTALSIATNKNVTFGDSIFATSNSGIIQGLRLKTVWLNPDYNQDIFTFLNSGANNLFRIYDGGFTNFGYFYHNGTSFYMKSSGGSTFFEDDITINIGSAGSVSEQFTMQSPRSYLSSVTDGVAINLLASNGTKGTHDYGSIRFGNNPATSDGGAATVSFRIGGSSSTSSNGEFLYASSVSAGRVDEIKLKTGSASTDAMIINLSGQVGIGTTPSYLLHVSGSSGVLSRFAGSTSDIRIELSNDARLFGIKVRDFGTGDDRLVISDETGSAERIWMNSSGNLTVNNSLYVVSGLTVGKEAAPLRRVEIYGTDSSFTDGPYVDFTTSADAYPLFQIYPYSHNEQWIGFDWYQQSGSSFGKSSSSTANFTLRHNAGTLYLYTNSGTTAGNDISSFNTALIVTAGGSFSAGVGSLATSATTGFLYIPICSGTPTGTPESISGHQAVILDETNDLLYVRTGAGWKYATLT